MIFLTGCSGLVGSFLVKALLLKGEKIVALKRMDSDLSLLGDIVNQIEWIEGDLNDVEVLKKHISRCDTVIHSAAVISFSPYKRDLMYHGNVLGTATIVNVALECNIKKFCYISSIAALGRSKSENVIDETSLWNDDEMNTDYARSKHNAELEVWRGIEEGLPAFIVNPSVILGPGNWNNGSTRLFKYVYDKNKFITKGSLSYVDVRDVVDIIIRLMDKMPVGERFILNGGEVSYKLFFENIAAAFNVQSPSIYVLDFFAEIIWRLEKLRTFFSKAEPIITRETVKLSRFNFTYKNDKIRQFLDFKFRDLNESITYTVKALKSRYVNKKH